MDGGAVGHNFEMGLPKDYPCQVWFNLAFQYCVRQPCPPFKMAAVTKNRNFFSCQFLLYYKSKLTQILSTATWQ
jgi:hypothetical protein